MFSTTLILLLLCLAKIAAMILPTEQPESSCSPLAPKLITQFDAYYPIIYYNNASRHCLDPYLKHPLIIRGHVLRNYDIDISNIHQSKTSRRRFHIVFMPDKKIVGDFLAEVNIKSGDVILMVSIGEMNIDLMLLCTTRFHRLRKSRGLFIIDNISKEITYCNFYYGKRRCKVVTVRVREGKIPKLRKMLNYYTDMGGYKFNVGYYYFPPLLYMKEVEGRKIVSGIEHTMMELFSEKLNFTYNYEDFSVGHDGMSIRNQLIHETMNNKIDWILSGLTLTYERSTVLDFMGPIIPENYIAVFSDDTDMSNNLNTFLENLFFKKTYMLWVVLDVLLVAILIKILEKSGRGEKRPLVLYIKMNALVLIDQTLPTTFTRDIVKWRKLTKVVILTWWLASLVHSNYLKVGLTVSLMRMRDSDVFDECDLLAKDYNFAAAAEDYDYLYAWCRYSSSSACYKVIEVTNIAKHLLGALNKAETEKIAVLIEEFPLNYWMQMNRAYHSESKLVGRKIGIGRGWQTWYFPQSTPYIEAFNKLLSRLQQSGLISYWYNQDQTLPKNRTIPHSPAYLKLEHFYNAFCFLLYGHALSFFVFLIEVFKINMEKLVCTSRRNCNIK